MNNGSRTLVMLAAGVILLMAAVLAGDVILSSTSIRVIGPPSGWTGEVLRSEMTGSYPVAAAVRGHAPVTGYAVYGVTGGGYGVFGTSSSNAGVRGNSTNGIGGYFTSGGGYGVYAYTTGASHWDHGIYATANNGYGLYAKSTNNDGVRGEGNQTGVYGTGNSRGVYGYSPSGDGVYGYSSNGHGVRGGSGSGNYGGYFTSAGYRGLYARGATNYYDAYLGGNLGIYVLNDIVAGGSKAGYVVDLARNDGQNSLELGDVVVIVGSTDPVLGEIPVPTVRLADESASTGVMGVVDRMFATPTFEKSFPEEITDAWRQLNAGSMTGQGFSDDSLPAESASIPLQTEEAQRNREPESPGRFVSQEEADFVAKAAGRDPGIAQGAYVGVVTLGAFKAIRVDASFGTILPGDLLVSSPTPGHAMRAVDPQPGTIIGKALGSLEEGLGTVPVLITLH